MVKSTCTAAALTGMTDAAPAQILEPSPAQREVLRDVQERDIRFGSFVLKPSITAGSRFDSNVYNRSSPRRSDVSVEIRPRVALETDLGRHSAQIVADATIERFATLTTENTEQFAVRGDTRLDFADQFTARTSIGYARRVEARGTFGDDLLTSEPVAYNELAASASASKKFNRLAATVGGSVVRGRYLDAVINGVRVDQSYRDFKKLSLQARADIALSARSALFVRGTYGDLSYRYRTSTSRDSNSYSVIAGASFWATELFELEAALGYIRQDFDNPALKDFSGLDYYVKGSWYPRRRIAFTASASRSIDRSPLPDTSSVLHSEIRVTGSYAATSKLLVGGEVAYIDNDYAGIDRNEHRISIAASARYLLTDRLSAFASAGYRHQTFSGSFGRKYEGASALIGLRLAL
ncbi:hypothetical protein GCM10023219_20990 [Stakelama sediminis]|nr:outer membrane beta-barrel protein [Stakelama sediminis]